MPRDVICTFFSKGTAPIVPTRIRERGFLLPTAQEIFEWKFLNVRYVTILGTRFPGNVGKEIVHTPSELGLGPKD
jgi:hypothetical protein